MAEAYLVLPSRGVVRYNGKALRFALGFPAALAKYLRGKVRLPETAGVIDGNPATIARDPKKIESQGELYDAMALLRDNIDDDRVQEIVAVPYVPGTLIWRP